ncbi:MAG: peroxiredoxin family protein [Rhodospirillaceae bacterium]|nr:peroxiredoxin family protein [Rhodospirillaceae bacterium]
MRDAYDKFQAAGIKLYAISYDDREVLAAYAEAEEIPFPLLSDIDSEVIRRYGILNTQVKPD